MTIYFKIHLPLIRKVVKQMNTKITKNQIIQALKIRMNSVMIERRFLDEQLVNGTLNEIQYSREVKSLLEDLQHYLKML